MHLGVLGPKSRPGSEKFSVCQKDTGLSCQLSKRRQGICLQDAGSRPKSTLAWKQTGLQVTSPKSQHRRLSKRSQTKPFPQVELLKTNSLCSLSFQTFPNKPLFVTLSCSSLVSKREDHALLVGENLREVHRAGEVLPKGSTIPFRKECFQRASHINDINLFL